MPTDTILRAMKQAWFEPHENGSVLVLPNLEGLFEDLAELCGWDMNWPAQVEHRAQQLAMRQEPPSMAIN